MKTTYHTQIRRVEGIDLHRDGDEFAALLAEMAGKGSRVTLRVKTRDRRAIDIPEIGARIHLGALAGLREALQAHGISRGVQSEGIDAEILVRDPRSIAADPTGAFRDRNDTNTLHWDGERGTGERKPEGPAATFRHAPLFFRDNGSAVDLIDLYRGGTVFLILNGASFGEREQALLRDKPGVMTFGVNNGGHAFRPNLWTCVDDPSRFMESIWKDGRVMKFVPMAAFTKSISQKTEGHGPKVGECPNVIGYRRNEAFCAEQWLWEDTINWGNHTKRGGGRSVMLVALRIAFLLGFRRVYLVGCDFEMTPERRYWFPEGRTEQAIRNNTNSYRILTGFFEALRPEFKKAGLSVHNCNPDSQLRIFPFADLETAVNAAAVDMSESTEGKYAAT